jgi:hypothetical protein
MREAGSDTLRLERRLLHGHVEVLVASDGWSRRYLGLRAGVATVGPYVFVEIDTDTLLDFESGVISLYEALESLGHRRILEMDAAAVQALRAALPQDACSAPSPL